MDEQYLAELKELDLSELTGHEARLLRKAEREDQDRAILHQYVSTMAYDSEDVDMVSSSRLSPQQEQRRLMAEAFELEGELRRLHQRVSYLRLEIQKVEEREVELTVQLEGLQPTQEEETEAEVEARRWDLEWD